MPRSTDAPWLLMMLALGGCRADTGPLEAGRRDAGTASLRDAGSRDAGTHDAGEVDGGIDGGVEEKMSDIGEPCADPSECRSADDPNASLFPTACIIRAANEWQGGYCTAFCTLPADPFVLPSLSRADCEEGAVCLPREAHPGQRPSPEIGACLVECNSDDDCRVNDGYFCRKTFRRADGDRTFDNGYCAPSHCSSRGCSAAFVCEC